MTEAHNESGNPRAATSALEAAANVVGAERLLLAADLFFPQFVEYRGCVLVPWNAEPSNVDRWLSECDGDVRAVESVLNHLHLWDLFPADVPDDRVARFGAALASCWGAALASQFPRRAFVTGFADDEDDYGPTVSFASED